jgi:hypothetical protein
MKLYTTSAKYLSVSLSLSTVALTATMLMGNVIAQEQYQPKLYEPYAPKPSGVIPAGWEIKILEGSQVENSTILPPKREVKITVPAYELVPKQEGGSVVLMDPGFAPKLSTAQKETIGAILTDYSEKVIDVQAKLEKLTAELEKKLGEEPKNKSMSINDEHKESKQSNDSSSTNVSSPSNSTTDQASKGTPNGKKKPNPSSR